MGGEDFAYYLQRTPGMFFSGRRRARRTGKNYPSLHNDRYDFTDAALAVGMRMYLGIVRNFPP